MRRTTELTFIFVSRTLRVEISKYWGLKIIIIHTRHVLRTLAMEQRVVKPLSEEEHIDRYG